MCVSLGVCVGVRGVVVLRGALIRQLSHASTHSTQPQKNKNNDGDDDNNTQ